MDIAAKSEKNSEEMIVAKEYLSSLLDLRNNSNYTINRLTSLAVANIEYAPTIKEVIKKQILRVPSDLKLPLMNLVDCISKSDTTKTYSTIFSSEIAKIFCEVFKKVSE